MSHYALLELLIVAAIVSIAVFTVALRLLPATWMRRPLGAWLDRDGVPDRLRQVAVRWRGAKSGGCAQGCCPTGDGCAIGRSTVPRTVAPRIPLRVLP